MNDKTLYLGWKVTVPKSKTVFVYTNKRHQEFQRKLCDRYVLGDLNYKITIMQKQKKENL
jgi:hypothetical protein